MGCLGILAPFPFWHLLDLSSLASFIQVLPLPSSPVPNRGPGQFTAGLPLPFLPTIPACAFLLSTQPNTFLRILSSFLIISVHVVLLFKNLSAISHPYFHKTHTSLLAFSSSWPKSAVCSSSPKLFIQVGILINPTENVHWGKQSFRIARAKNWVSQLDWDPSGKMCKYLTANYEIFSFF